MRALVLASALVWSGAVHAFDADPGKAVFDAAGCLGCHTDKKNGGRPLAGGRAMPTEFGTFYTPNITPAGLKGWTYRDFKAAMRHGLRPDGAAYYPAFPYTSYTNMSEADIGFLWAYLQTVAPVERANTPHDLKWPYAWRWTLKPWRLVFFEEGPRTMERGEYLVEALGHCGECHTPRGVLGQMDKSRLHAGTAKGPKGGAMPNLTPDKESGLGWWMDGDFELFFVSGLLPDGDVVGGAMSEVIDNTTAKWSVADRKAVIAYLKGLKAMPNSALKPKTPPTEDDEDW